MSMCPYSRVKLAIHEDNNTAVAVKIIALSNDRKRKEEIRKEVGSRFTLNVSKFA